MASDDEPEAILGSTRVGPNAGRDRLNPDTHNPTTSLIPWMVKWAGLITIFIIIVVSFL